ncbi:glycosyltransferase family 2 protein [Rathayibacter festucae]|uniref:glycosyltransferase family 2 protein n=1 Tax=Rathayibacter festucae TaxID=110937 RepID=UPI001FB4654A|nr:glycosyltransferase family 2 protein [Rathayibacter festucae]MCJ1698633.1 glycosyltransferase family 2 protein [Rathayibacter festucae]
MIAHSAGTLPAEPPTPARSTPPRRGDELSTPLPAPFITRSAASTEAMPIGYAPTRERSWARTPARTEPAAPAVPATPPAREGRHTSKPVGRLVAVLPAHNEEEGIAAAILGLQTQTSPPDRIVVVTDNCTDRTAEIAIAHGAEVFATTGNTAKKAGALNQFLEVLLLELEDEDLVLVQDADSALDPDFLAIARLKIGIARIGAVGGVFRGTPGGGLVGHLQRNEYARYARDVRRLNGKCLVVTGTAAVLRGALLREISRARRDGRIPAGDGRGGIYDTTVLTEDNELTFAIKHLGYEVLSPAGCTLVTEIMPTWRELWNQRLRWKRGAVENCVQYGLTRVTWPYWGRQLLTMAGCFVTYVYLATVVYALVMGGLSIQPFWLAVTLIFVVERVVTVRDRGWRHMLLAGLMYELFLDLFLQIVHTKAYLDALTRRQRAW